MNAGEMTECASIVRKTRTQRADGGYDVTTADVATDLWCKVTPVAARENEEAGRLRGATTYLFEFFQDDLPDDITTDDYLQWTTPQDGTVTLDISAIRMPRNRELTVQIVGEAGEIV